MVPLMSWMIRDASLMAQANHRALTVGQLVFLPSHGERAAVLLSTPCHPPLPEPNHEILLRRQQGDAYIYIYTRLFSLAFYMFLFYFSAQSNQREAHCNPSFPPGAGHNKEKHLLYSAVNLEHSPGVQFCSWLLLSLPPPLHYFDLVPEWGEEKKKSSNVGFKNASQKAFGMCTHSEVGNRSCDLYLISISRGHIDNEWELRGVKPAGSYCFVGVGISGSCWKGGTFNLYVYFLFHFALKAGAAPFLNFFF